MISTILYLLVVGAVAGFIARAVLPGDDPMTWWQTILLGIVGSFIGGFAGYLIFGFDSDEGAFQPGGVIGSILGAIVALLAWRAIRKRTGGSAPRTPA